MRMRLGDQGHGRRVTAVDFDENYIVSACGNTITVWETSSGEFVRNLFGHVDELLMWINYLEYRDNLLVSGGDDYSIR